MSRRRTSRRAQRAKKKNMRGWLMIGGVGIALIAAFAAQIVQHKEADRFDKKTFCPKAGDVSITAVMIDQTDALSPIQQAALRNELEKIRDEIPAHGRLEIYAVGNTISKTLEPVFSMCSPGRGSDVKSELYENSRIIERRWEKAFDGPIERILEKLLSAPAAKESPILESIQSITVTAFNTARSEGGEKRLIIASDMIQHTPPEFSLYKKPDNYALLRENDYFRKMRAHLKDVDVEVLMFRRNNGANIQNKDFLNFWDAFFNDQGATLQRVYSISG